MPHGPEFDLVVLLVVVLLMGAAARMVTRRLPVPFTVAMLALGAGAGLLVHGAPPEGTLALLLEPLARSADIEPDLILLVFLPILIFESAFSLDVHAFRRNLGAVLVYAGPGLILAALATGAALVALTAGSWAWGWGAALVFGALISATDPVAVVATLREAGAPKRLALLVEGESMLNDGTAIVLYSIVGVLLTGRGHLDVGLGVVEFFRVTGGGLLVGIVLAGAISAWLRRVFDQPLVEITLTVVLAYGAMLVSAALLDVSGVIAVVTAGLWMAGPGRVDVSPEVMHFLHRFWEMLAFLANTVIFFLVGLVVVTQVGASPRVAIPLGLGAYAVVMALRFALIFGLRPVLSWLGDPISPREALVVAWGGMRGAVSLALALAVAREAGVDRVLGEQILAAAAIVVLLTILVNGATTGPLLRRLGFDRPPAGDRLTACAVSLDVLDEVGEQIDALSQQLDLRTVDWQEVHDDLGRRREDLHAQMEQARVEQERQGPAERATGPRRRLLEVERAAAWKAFADGTLSGPAAQSLDHAIDLEMDRLALGTPIGLRQDQPLPAWRLAVARLVGRLGPIARQLQFDLLAFRYDLIRGRAIGATRARRALEDMEGLDADVAEGLRAEWRGRLARARHALEDLRTNLPEVTRAVETHLARRIQLNLERDDLLAKERRGELAPDAAAVALEDVKRRMVTLRRSAKALELPETATLCKQTPLFAGLDEALLQRIADLTLERVFGPGEALCVQGEPGRGLFVVARGAAGVYREDAGVETLLDVLGGGDLVGEMALFTGAPRYATVRALTTVTVGEVTRRDFQALLDLHSGLRERVLRDFAARRFDNHLRGRPGYTHLDHPARLAWFDRGRVWEVEPESDVEVPPGASAFVALGALVDGTGARFEAPALVRPAADALLHSPEPAVVALLPPLRSA